MGMPIQIDNLPLNIVNRLFQGFVEGWTFQAGYGSMSLSTNPNRPTMRVQTDVYRNEAVLLALRKLTGVDFGYEVNAWNRWVAQSYRPSSSTPGRRVPQP